MDIGKDDPRLDDLGLGIPERNKKNKPDITITVHQTEEGLYNIWDIDVPNFTSRQISDVRATLSKNLTPNQLQDLLPRICDKFGKHTAVVERETGEDRDGMSVDPHPVFIFDRLKLITDMDTKKSPAKSKLN